MKSRPLLPRSLVIFSLGLLMTAGAHAQTVFVWLGTGADGIFSTPQNWVGLAAPTAIDSVQFGPIGPAYTEVRLAPTTAITNIEFLATRDTPYPFTADNGSAAALTLNGDIPVAAGNSVAFDSTIGLILANNTTGNTFDVAAATSLQFDGVISGAGHFAKTGAGTLTLTGANTFNYTGGGSFTNSSAINAGTVHLDGGSITHTGTGDITIGDVGGDDGTLLISNDGSASDYFGVLGQSAGSTGTATVDGSGSTWTHSSGLDVGYSGTGTLNILNGGWVTVSGTHSMIGYGGGSTGTATVDGIGSTLANAAEFHVGEYGTGTLTISAGGSVNDTVGIIANLGGVSTATVTGNGSLWTNTSYLYVGAVGNGTLNIQAGGDVTSIDTSVGNNPGGYGTVNIDGVGSTLTNTGNLYVGSEGDGNLYISNGGTATNTIGSVGNNLGGSGYASVYGTGSTWTNTGALLVGNADYGYLSISTGGTVNSTTGHIGELTAVEGGVYLNGAGSSWNLSGDLYVGNGGNGTLRVLDQSHLNVASGAGTIHLGHSSGGYGELDIGYDEGSSSGMVINAAQITTGAGNGGTINFGTNATKASPFYLTKDGTSGGTPVIITGPTEVYNQGGYNVLNGANTYTGGTNINGGTLVAAHNTALGTGTVYVTYGRLDVASGVTLANPVNISYGTLGGNGTFGSLVSLSNSVTLAPGASPGTLTFAGGLALSDGSFDFEVQSALGAAGTGYDTVNVSGGSLDFENVGTGGYTLRLISLNGGGTAGDVSDFSSANPYSWTVFSATNAIQYFDANQFVIDTTSFSNNLGIGSFFVDSDGNNIYLNFTPVPEPSTYALMVAGLAFAGLGYCRQKRQSRRS